jgi:hypothetical protein
MGSRKVGSDSAADERLHNNDSFDIRVAGRDGLTNVDRLRGLDAFAVDLDVTASGGRGGSRA